MAKLRKLNINDNIWKYYLKGQRGNIIIFSPFGQRYQIALEDFLKWQGSKDAEYETEMLCYSIKPGDITKFIMEKYEGK